MTQSLPPQPNLQQLRNQAKDLYKAIKSADPAALSRVASVFAKAGSLPQEFKLSTALLVVAREYGFSSWMKLKAHVDAATRQAGDLTDPDANDPAAMALLSSMFAAIRKPSSLHVKVQTTMTFSGNGFPSSKEFWLKKPALARVDESRENEVRHRLICDGETTGAIWPQGRPAYFPGEDKNNLDLQRQYWSFSSLSGLRDPNARMFGVAITTVDLAIFHGLQHSYLEDNVMGLRWGQEAVFDGELCHCLHFHYPGGNQILDQIWIADGDRLPRRLLSQVSSDMQTEEVWTDIQIDCEIPDNMFQWRPPADGIAWTPPSANDVIIRPGERAPDFEFQAARGEHCSLQGLAGRTVILVSGLRVTDDRGAKRLRALHSISIKFQKEAFALVGVAMFGQSAEVVADFQICEGVTFPICCDPKIIFGMTSAYRIRAANAFVIVGPDGMVVEAWTEDFDRLEPAIRKALADNIRK